jgi:four helix bundle protein
MKDFRELQVWQKAHQLTLMVYQTTVSFPRADRLTSQLRRASTSIAANLAEGCGRIGNAELARFCSIAMGSAGELEYQPLLARDLNMLSADDHQHLHLSAVELKRMLAGLLQKLKADR